MENLDEMELIDEQSEISEANRLERVEQNQIVRADSVLESFPSGSSSTTYTPSGHVLLENVITDGQLDRRRSGIDSLITLLREQIGENQNLRVTLTDLEATVADLRLQLHERDQVLRQLSGDQLVFGPTLYRIERTGRSGTMALINMV